MNKSDIDDYINKLKRFEEELSSEESGDFSLIKDLDNLLGALNDDVTNTITQESNRLNVKIKN